MHVGRHDRPGRFASGTSQQVHGHTGSVLDMDWNPFDDSMFASASEDTTIKLWSIPDDWEPTDASGLARSSYDNSITESLVDLVGHRKKVTLLRFHPTANNVLASTSADHTVRFWDVEKAEEISTLDGFGDHLIQDIVWDVRGEVCATSCKDKIVRFCDPRAGQITSTIEKAHDGLKSVKLAYLGETGKILTAGTSKGREVKIWDLKNLSKPLFTESIDSASGALLPLYDNDTTVLYLCGKGDGIIRPYEFEDKAPYLHKLNDGFRSTCPAKGLCMIPKRGNNIMDCETARILKLTNSEGMQPLSFIVPRKSDAFQDDIFPDAPSSNPAHTSDEWREGSSKLPLTTTLNPAMAQQNGKKTKMRTVATLSAELKQAQERIEFLEEKLKENNIDV